MPPSEAAPTPQRVVTPLDSDLQHTIAEAVSLSGRGLFGGEPATITFHPAEANHGVVFQCVDQRGARIPALVRHVIKRPRRTSIKCQDAQIDTCEHVLSALAALGVDNVLIEVEGPEVPGLDGSSKPFVDAILSAGLTPCEAPRRRLVIDEPVMVRQGDATLAILPSDDPGLELVYSLEYPDGVIGRQVFSTRLGRDDYPSQIAPARTFILESEARVLRSQGMGKHLTPEQLLVLGENGPLGGNRLRFPDEPVRHKMLDLIGDLYLLGAQIQGRVLAHKSGHALHHALVRKLATQLRRQTHQRLSRNGQLLDSRKLTKILPHRYPMLLVDRVMLLEEHRIVGIKNVTINEPFFQGHYPGTPIMPGVLIVEAMAQLSGVLIAQSLEHKGKLPVLLSLDKVKLRRAVTPGDQLILEAESVRVRSRIAHMSCKAFLGQDVAAEAEVKFMLVDDDQE